MRIGTAIKLTVLVLVLAAVGVGIWLFRRATDPENVRQALLSELRKATGGDVAIRAASLNLLHGQILARDIAISLPGQGEPLFACPLVVMSLDRTELLTGHGVVRRVVAIEPKVRLAYDMRTDSWNVEALGGGEAAGPARQAGPPEPAAAQPSVTGPLLDGVVIEDATISLRHPELFGDERERVYPGVRLALSRDRASPQVWQVTGQVRGGAVAGVNVEGWFDSRQPNSFDLSFSCAQLVADAAFWQQVPYGAGLWKDYRMEGPFSLDGRISRLNEGPTEFLFRIGLHGDAVRTKYVPMPLRSVKGKIEVSSRSVSVEGLSAVISPDEFASDGDTARPPLVHMDGSFNVGRPGFSMRARALNLPLCRKTLEAVPQSGTALWERFQPSGPCDLELTVSEPPDGGPTEFHAVVRLNNVSIRPAEVPSPLTGMTGMVRVDPDGVRLEGIRGMLGELGESQANRPSFAVDGFVSADGREMSLQAKLHDVRTDEALVRAVPSVGEQVWDTLRPELTLDATVSLRSSPDEPEATYATVLDIHGGRVRLRDFPLPLEHVTGAVRTSGQTVDIERLQARLRTEHGSGSDASATSLLSATGTVDLPAERADLYVAVDDLLLTRNLLEALPEVGKSVWESFQPRGVVSVTGKLYYDGKRKPRLRYFLDVSLKDVSVLPAAPPLPVRALAGDLLVSGDRILSNRLSGVTCGGAISGSAILYYGVDQGAKSYGASLEFDRLDLAELVRRLSGKEPNVSGRLEGVVHLGGVPGQKASMRALGRVRLRQGNLWKTPFIVRLVNLLSMSIPTGESRPVEGGATFTLKGDEVLIKNLTLNGGGLALSGRGKIWLDGRLDMAIVAVSAPGRGLGIPIVSSLLGWLLRTVESELVRVDVTGTLGHPQFEHRALSKVTWPLTSLRGLLFSPIFGTGG